MMHTHLNCFKFKKIDLSAKKIFFMGTIVEVRRLKAIAMGHISKYSRGDRGGNDGGGERRSDSGCFENIMY